MSTDEVLVLLLAVWVLFLTVAFIVRFCTPSKSIGPRGYTGEAGRPGPQGPKGDGGNTFFIGKAAAETIDAGYFINEPSPSVNIDPLSGKVFFTDHQGMEVPSTFAADSNIGRLGIENRQLKQQISDLEQERRELLDVVSALRKDNRKRQEEMMDQSANHQAEQKRLDADAVMLRRRLDDSREDNEKLKQENTRLKKTKRFYENKFIPNGPRGEE